MPLADHILNSARRIVGSENLPTRREDLVTYPFDGTGALRQMPGSVCLIGPKSLPPISKTKP